MIKFGRHRPISQTGDRHRSVSFWTTLVTQGHRAASAHWRRLRPLALPRLENLVSGWFGLPILLLGLCIASFAVMLPGLGYYWDDWHHLWTAHTFGPQGLITSHAADRPIFGALLAAPALLLGESPLSWHVFALLMRWANAVVVWAVLRTMWPKQGLLVSSVVVLYVIHPAFTQQAIAWTATYIWIQQAIFWASVGAMILSVRYRRQFWPLTGLALLGSVLQMQISEYFMGLELFRPILLLWLLPRPAGRLWDWLRRVALYSAPYVAALTITVVIQAIVIDPNAAANRQLTPILEQIAAQPVAELSQRVPAIASDIINGGLTAWARAIVALQAEQSLRFRAVSVALAILSSIAVYIMLALTMHHTHSVNAVRPKWPAEVEAIGLGAAAVVFGMLPIWLSNRQILWTDGFDRHAIPGTFGFAMLLAGGLLWAIGARRRFGAIIAILVGIAVAFHLQTGYAYRQDWQRQTAFIWQLSWRAPQLETGTTILLYQEPQSLPQPKDYTFAEPVNLLYAPENRDGQVPYWTLTASPPYRWIWFRTAAINDGSRQPPPNEPQLGRQIRTLSFAGQAADIVVMTHVWPGCLRVLDPMYNEMPHLQAMVEALAAQSQPERILTQPMVPARPLAAIYGSEPEHGWCYLFQKADLARQNEAWGEVVRLGDLARSGRPMGIQPADATEWLVFLEGYIRARQYVHADEIITWLATPADTPVLTLYAHEIAGARIGACSLLARVEPENVALEDWTAFHADARQKLGCHRPTAPID